LGARYLGPGEVIFKSADRLVLRLGDGRTVTARCALAFPYEPALADELLTVGESDSFYVIGVLRGSGATRLGFDGDVELIARGGTVRIAGDRGITLESPDVKVETQRFSLLAEIATSLVGSLRQQVRDLFTLRAKEHHTVVEEDILQHSKRTRLVAEEKVTVNGKEIFLG